MSDELGLSYGRPAVPCYCDRPPLKKGDGSYHGRAARNEKEYDIPRNSISMGRPESEERQFLICHSIDRDESSAVTGSNSPKVVDEVRAQLTRTGHINSGCLVAPGFVRDIECYILTS